MKEKSYHSTMLIRQINVQGSEVGASQVDSPEVPCFVPAACALMTLPVHKHGGTVGQELYAMCSGEMLKGVTALTMNSVMENRVEAFRHEDEETTSYPAGRMSTMLGSIMRVLSFSPLRPATTCKCTVCTEEVLRIAIPAYELIMTASVETSWD